MFDAIERCLTNRLDSSWRARPRFAAVIGDAPSRYSKSPRLWNAAFDRLNIDALYLPFDVDDARLGDLVSILRNSETFLGANVTVPHKLRIMEFLDAIDPGARRIQAVNTVVRSGDGKLTGYNTDGEGFINSLRLPVNSHAPLESLNRINALLLGAGGSARAVAINLAGELDTGTLYLCNRTIEHAMLLADEVARLGAQARAIPEEQLDAYAPRAGLIVNCTTKGQGGPRKVTERYATLLEPYSALAPARPPIVPADALESEEGQRKWREAALADIEANQQQSLRIAQAIPPATLFYDLIYHPDETVFLKHGRSTGHQTMNGKSMIVHQAALAFANRICQRELRGLGLDTAETQATIVRTMYDAW